MAPHESDDDLLTVTELSQWLRIQPSVVLELADKNNPKLQLPSIRGVGNRLLFRRGDVRAWCKKASEFDC